MVGLAFDISYMDSSSSITTAGKTMTLLLGLRVCRQPALLAEKVCGRLLVGAASETSEAGAPGEREVSVGSRRNSASKESLWS